MISWGKEKERKQAEVTVTEVKIGDEGKGADVVEVEFVEEVKEERLGMRKVEGRSMCDVLANDIALVAL